MRFCNKCKTERPLIDFRDHSWCKPCYREYDNKRYKDKRGDEVRAYQSQWRRLNKEKVNSYVSARKAAKLERTPSWLSENQLKEIENFYLLALDCCVTSGQKYQVDHIVPLRGVNVCGLHVPWNLQILPDDLNKSKSNR